MKNKNNNDLVNDYLQSIDADQQPGAGDFFYTRLKARMEREKHQGSYVLPAKPAWIIAGLAMLLLLNVFILGKSGSAKMETGSQSGLENFGTTYGLIISTNY